MSNNKYRRKPRFTLKKLLVITLMTILISLTLFAGSVGLAFVNILTTAPEIDPYSINSGFEETSLIFDKDKNLLEKVETAEYRTFVKLNKVPQYLKDAFISIEDERFYEHPGVDPKGILSSLYENFKAGGVVRGASTITQQLIKNTFLSNEQTLTRKLKEIYLALNLETKLSKDQILESYLNMISLGQNSYGVQEASRTYFSKNVDEINIAQAALLAGIVKGPNIYQPFYRVSPLKFDEATMRKIGETEILGEKYILVFNTKSVQRQKVILKKMLELGKINKTEYDEAINFDVVASLKPSAKKESEITSYATDYVKNQVVEDLMEKYQITKQKAQERLFTGGLRIYSTIDTKVQKDLDEVNRNFNGILLGDLKRYKAPLLVDRNLDKAGNIVDKDGNLVYYKKENLLTDDGYLFIPKGEFSINANGDLAITSSRILAYKKSTDIQDYYTIDGAKNLLTHRVGGLAVPDAYYLRQARHSLIIKAEFFEKNDKFYKVNETGNLFINPEYFYNNKTGLVQPQSATVIMDYKTGHIVAMIGGRDVKGSRILNRATDTARQPGSSMKPLAVYLPALDNGFTAASPILDIPMITADGKVWPNNVYTGFKGITTLRESLIYSINVSSARTLKKIGIPTSIKYLKKLGIINEENPSKDNFVQSSENKTHNDENLASLALGGMTKGVSPLDMTAAYSAIANDGVYNEPIIYTKVLDKDGNIVLEKEAKQRRVVSPQIAYVMKDILRSTAYEHTGKNAIIKGQASAGKTGTTDYNADFWFVGFTNYYAAATWMGNDSPKITITQNSWLAAKLWGHIMTKIHQDKESKPQFAQPDGIVKAYVCTKSGKKPNQFCSSDPRGVVREEIFAKGTEPTETCNVHVALKVNSSNNKLATEFTPEELKITKVFTALNPAYNPAEHNGILPKDYSYYPPVQSDTQEDLNNYNQEHGIDLNEEGINWNDVITDIINTEKKDDKKEEKKNDDNEVKILP
ncbi:transglycosylase domain-containing protein [Fenollaria massiliensis]|uniref:Penicillin-binding protein 1A n=1 Tax=Fenollaria massiliensis TaxID=938288 RepID=A0A9E7ITM7_9FIRM|nr:PBP1A family penicillin-binding protein [Fenollaria massiliensis]UQK58613.1 PBP1A family penicillin-binding protein [Fenollaria massiliensis]